jgi:hypothetical protein
MYLIRNKCLFIFLMICVSAMGVAHAGFSAKDTDTIIRDKNDEGTIVFYEGFEMGMPSGWLQEYIIVPDGFDADWDVRRGAGLVDGTNWGDPDTAAVGNRNLAFQFQGYGHVTRIVTPPIDLEFIVNPVLNFWHAQAEWQPNEYDRLTIYYRKGEHGEWNYLRQFDQLTPVWTERSISLDDHDSDKYYFALEGLNSYGFGVLIDEFTVEETGIIPKVLDNFTTEQASLNFVPTGSMNNPVLRSVIRVTGNTGSLVMNHLTVKSLNTDDNDVSGLKLYATESEMFHTHQLVGELDGFVNGEAVFTNLMMDLPTGYTYLWLTCDIANDAGHNNTIDAYIPANGMGINTTLFPAEDQSPFGNREIFESIFYDDFDTDKGWILTGEWERDEPMGYGGTYGSNGLNGSYGHPGASYPFVGSKILGTDLTGLGAFPGNYEPGLDSLAYLAISPSFNCFYYKDVTLSFERWLNAEPPDKVWIEMSTDEGNTWETIWINTDFYSALNWTQQSYQLSEANRSSFVRLRFGIGPTDDLNHYSGWNIDNLVVTGSYVTQDAGITQWVGPNEGCGMGHEEIVVVNVKNFGAEEITEPVPLGFTLDGGLTWHMDTIYGGFQVGESREHTFTPRADFSVPARYNDIVVKTFWENDQDDSNDSFDHTILSLPYIAPPYAELFIEDDGLWTGYGSQSSWQWGEPSGEIIDEAVSGSSAWFTNMAGAYQPSEASWLESPCFDFRAMENPVIEFYLQTHTLENMDGVSIQYTANEGENWFTLEPLGEELAWEWQQETEIIALESNFNSNSGWHGESDGWHRVRAVLGNEIAQQEKIQFRLVFASSAFDPEGFLMEGIGFDAVSLFEAPHDLGVVALINPDNACELSNEQAFTIQIENLGISSLPAGTQIPTAIEVGEYETIFEFCVLENDLEPGYSVDYTFHALFDVSIPQSYPVKSYTMLPGDTDFYQPGIFNDTLNTQITVFGYPEYALGNDIYTTMPDTVVLDAGDGFISYLWQDGSEEQTFSVSSGNSAFYKVSVTDTNGCSVKDSLEVIARDLSITAITQPVSDCELSDEEYISAEIINSGPDPYVAGTEIPVQILYGGVLYDETLLYLTQDLMPGATVLASFQNVFDFSEMGKYDFRLIQSFRDAHDANDTLDYSLFVYGYPKPWIGDTIYTLQPENVELDAGESYVSFLWQDGATDQIYPVSSPFTDWYSVLVTDTHGCSGSDSVLVVAYDLEVAEIVAPNEACELSDQENISVKIINNGPDAFDEENEFAFALEYNGELLGIDTLRPVDDWLPGNELVFNFSPAVDMQTPGSYPLRIYSVGRDAHLENDTLDFTIVVHGYPEIFLPPYVTTDNPEMIVLDPEAEGNGCLWQDGSTDAVFQVETWGDYWVEVSNDFGCTATANTTIYPELFDLTIDTIVAPREACADSDVNEVVVNIYNSGYSKLLPETEVTVSYRVGHGETVTESFQLQAPLLPQESILFTFNQTFPVVFGVENEILADVMFDADEVEENNSITTDFTINPLPQPCLGDDICDVAPAGTVLCPGEGFESYLWQDGSTSPSYLVESPHTNTYKVRVTDEKGCSNMDSIQVITYDLEVNSVIAPRSHCVLSDNEPVILQLFNEGIDDLEVGSELELGYRSPDNAFLVTESFILSETWYANTQITFEFEQSLDLSYANQFNLEVFVITPNADQTNDTVVSFVEITGRPEVKLGPDIYTNQIDTIELDAGAGFASYLWHDGHEQQYYDVSSYGWKWVVVTDQYGCQGSDTLYVGFYANIEDELSGFTSTVYPNPASEILQVELENIPLEGVVVSFVDINGRMIYSEKIDPGAIREKEISLEDLPSGVYLLRISGTTLNKTHRITVVK